MMDTQHTLTVLMADLTPKDCHIGVCSGHYGFIMEASDHTRQSTDPVQPYSNHCVSPGLALIPSCLDRKVDMLKWKLSESPFS